MKSQKGKLRRKLINGTKGAITILLCLLLTPFMSIALGLVEYYRYQNVISLTTELMELTGLSALTDYDTYIHDRFGLLAVSQQQELNKQGIDLLETNTGVLGNQVTINSSSVSGSLALSNNEILRNQVIDVSELTGTTAVLLEDFNIEELLKQLNVVERFESIINTVNALADLSSALSDAVDAAEALKQALENLQAAILSAKSEGEQLAQQLTELYEKLSNAGIYIPQGATLEDITAIVTSFADGYSNEIKSITATASRLLSSLSSIKSNAQTVLEKAKAFLTAVEAAESALDSMSGESAENSAISKEAKNTLQDVLAGMVEAAEKTVQEISDSTIQTLKDTVDNLVSAATSSLGIAELVSRYGQMISGEYFQLPLSDLAKSDLTKLLSLVPAAWESGTADQILQQLKQMFVPSINIDTQELINKLSEVITNASNALKNKITSKLLELLTELVNVVKNLFDLDVFYEPDLNALVDIAGSGEYNAYQDFIDAIGDIFDAIEDFKDAVEDTGLISKIKGILGAMKDLFTAIGKTLKAILNIAKLAIDSIAELGSCLLTGNLQGLYEKLLIAGYMRHNLPNRLNSSSFESSYDENSAQAKYKVTLTGSGLTGFDYNKIARPDQVIGQTGSRGFTGMAQMINDLKNGHGSDTMFKGAELEYIRAGTNSELVNQTIVFFDLYFLRLLLDAASVFTDIEVGAVAAAATIASWAVYLLYLVAEPFCDSVLLVNGETVPLIKTKCYLTASGISGFVDKLSGAVMSDELKTEFDNFVNDYAGDSSGGSSGSGSSGSGSSDFSAKQLLETDYATHVLILLLIYVESDAMIDRFADIVQLEATEYYSDFSMYQTYTVVTVDANITFNSFFDLSQYTTGTSQLFTAKLKQMVSY